MTEIKDPTPQQIQRGYQQLEKEISVYTNKVQEMEGELREHELVIMALEKADPTRRCLRLVGEALAERTVQEVKPEVMANKERIGAALKQLQDQLQQRAQTRKQFMEKYGLNRTQQQTSAEAQKEAKENMPLQSQGVLV